MLYVRRWYALVRCAIAPVEDVLIDMYTCVCVYVGLFFFRGGWKSFERVIAHLSFRDPLRFDVLFWSRGRDLFLEVDDVKAENF